MAKKQFISPDSIHAGPTYSHAVRTGNTIYLAGKVGRDARGEIVDGGIEAQARQAFHNLQATLDAAGATMRDIVKLTLFLKNLDDMAIVSRVRGEFLSAPMPASTAVEVSRLAPGILLEIDGIAVIDDA